MKEKIHQGKNVKRFREMLGVKQEALALDLGEEWNQRKVSVLEQKEIIDDFILQKISDVLKIPVEVFQSFDEEQAVNIIANTVTNNDHAVMHALYSTNAMINPVDRIIQLHEEKIALYERMLNEKDEMMKKLESLIK